jgi:multiple sugar transport system ATP-binding protein
MNFADVTVNESGGALVAEATGFRIHVPPAQTPALKPYKGQRVTLGIRPEDIHMAGGADSPQHSFDAVVDVVEPLGSEILLDVKAGTSTLVARVDPTVRAKVHEQVRLAMNPDRLHFFDSKTEQAI